MCQTHPRAVLQQGREQHVSWEVPREDLGAVVGAAFCGVTMEESEVMAAPISPWLSGHASGSPLEGVPPGHP